MEGQDEDATVSANAARISEAVRAMDIATEAAEAADRTSSPVPRRFKRKAPGCINCGGLCDRPCGGAVTARAATGSTTTSFDGRKKRRMEEPLPPNFGQVPGWLRRRAAIGGTDIHASHVPHLGHHRGITWCWRCGFHCILVPNKLTGLCADPTVSGERQLRRLRIGQTPRNTIEWPNPL